MAIPLFLRAGGFHRREDAGMGSTCEHRTTTTSTESQWDSARRENVTFEITTCTDTCGAQLSRVGPR